MTDKPNKKESTTDVSFGWEGARKTVSFRCNENLWKAFVSQIKAEGGTVCNILEAVISGVLGLVKTEAYKRSTITIESLNVQRQVQRVRRYKKEYVAGPAMGSGPEWEGVTSVTQDVVTGATVKVYGSRLKCCDTLCRELPGFEVHFTERFGGPITQFFCESHFRERRAELMRRRLIWGYQKL